MIFIRHWYTLGMHIVLQFMWMQHHQLFKVQCKCQKKKRSVNNIENIQSLKACYTQLIVVYVISVWPIFSPNQIAVFWMSISWRQRIYWYMNILRCMDMFLITKILDSAYVQNYISQTLSYLAYICSLSSPLRPLIVKTLTNIL